MSQFTLLPTNAIFKMKEFDFASYIEVEREFWIFFPETEGKRVNFIQKGLTSMLVAEVEDDGSEIGFDETYVLIPHADNTMRPVRMKAVKHLTLSDYRMMQLTAVKLMGLCDGAVEALSTAGSMVMGEEVESEIQYRMENR